ncbi:hypothetical protein INT45_005278 [Circinella minor]|uniref:BED-type domain-containing protein n=1 Tax=Circinella minor TaxID=1195481 RepID=A0A8H7VRV4_9FUNG|nr:hypothetical protein INT45_005278 [Circinella minor]
MLPNQFSIPGTQRTLTNHNSDDESSSDRAVSSRISRQGSFMSISRSMSYMSTDGEMDGAESDTSQANQTQLIQSNKRAKHWLYQWYDTEMRQGIKFYTCQQSSCKKRFKDPKGTTTGLKNHLIKHGINEQSSKDTPFPSQGLDRFLAPNPLVPQRFDQQLFRDKLALFITTASLPYTIAENPHFQAVLNMAQITPSLAHVKLPSDSTIPIDISRVYRGYEDRIRKLKWRVPFLGITAHWIDESWKQNSIVLDLKLLEGSYTGVNMTAAFTRVLEHWNLQEKPFFLTADNASNMKTMATELELELGSDVFDSKENRIPCIAHIINLTTQDILRGGLKAEARDSEEHMLDDRGDNMIGSGSAGKILQKLRKGIVTIRASPQREYTEGESSQPVRIIESRELILDTPTRWNSTYYMIARALVVKQAYNRTLRGIPELQKFELTDDEWQCLQKISELLFEFARLTPLISGESYPTMNLVITAYNRLLNVLEAHIEAWNDLSAAAKVGWVKLQGYYCKATGHVYAIATAMDLRFKYEWWEAENWDEYRSEAIELVNTTWDKYKPAFVPVQQAYDPDALIQRRPGRADQLAWYINAYTLDDPTSGHSNTIVLDYWRGEVNDWPQLKAMARTYLGVFKSQTFFIT